MKKLTILVAACALVAGLPLGIGVATAAPHGITCSLSGTANFDPGLTASAQQGKYTFTGKFENCQSSDATATSATVKAAGSGSIGCGVGSTNGTATIKWNNGKKTKITFSTDDAAAGVHVSAKVIKSTESAILPGDQSQGVLAFQADPTQCNTADGVKSAAFSGQIGAGNGS
jgi:hypothetical protein